ncbi:MAG TPA: hypothetical protein VFD89_04155 [Clostridia bacterium]|nr:hypothetical protein [Clostridia bacterium]
MKELLNIITADVFRCILNDKNLKVCQLNSIINLLIKEEIQFTLTFTPMTPTAVANAALAIQIRPDISLSIIVSFDSGTILL